MASNDNMTTMNATEDGTEDAGQPTALMSSFFPSPPAYFAHFTTRNLELAQKLVSHPEYKAEEKRRSPIDTQEDTDSHSSWKDVQSRLLGLLDVSGEEKERVKDIDLASLVTPPDVDLIEEDGHWMAFGQAWPVSFACNIYIFQMFVCVC